jgi:hypothetical protein
MLSKRLDIPFNVYKESILAIVEKCFSDEYVVTKINENEFKFLRILQSSKGREVIRRLTVIDRGVIKIVDRSLWIELDVSRILFFTFLIDILLIVTYWNLNFLLFPLVFSLVVAITIFGWYMMINKGNSFIDKKLEMLQNQFKTAV